MSNTSRNLIPAAKQGLNKFKLEIASSVGIKDYATTDKGSLTSRQNGSVGGEMVKRMVESYEKSL